MTMFTHEMTRSLVEFKEAFSRRQMCSTPCAPFEAFEDSAPRAVLSKNGIVDFPSPVLRVRRRSFDSFFFSEDKDCFDFPVRNEGPAIEQLVASKKTRKGKDERQRRQRQDMLLAFIDRFNMQHVDEYAAMKMSGCPWEEVEKMASELVQSWNSCGLPAKKKKEIPPETAHLVCSFIEVLVTGEPCDPVVFKPLLGKHFTEKHFCEYVEEVNDFMEEKTMIVVTSVARLSSIKSCSDAVESEVVEDVEDCL